MLATSTGALACVVSSVEAASRARVVSAVVSSIADLVVSGSASRPAPPSPPHAAAESMTDTKVTVAAQPLTRCPFPYSPSISAGSGANQEVPVPLQKRTECRYAMRQT